MKDFVNSNLSYVEREHILEMQSILLKIGEWLDENPDQRLSLENKLLEIDVSKRCRNLIYKLDHEREQLYKFL